MLWLFACIGGESKAPDQTSFRAVFIADSHVIGANYQCCSESDGIDNQSIMKTPERLTKVVREINALKPAPDLVFLLGDIVHNAYVEGQIDYYTADNGNAFSVAHEILRQLNVPFYPVFGNHDYSQRCGGGFERELSHQLFAEFWGAEPYYQVDHKGWSFIVVNSQLGHTWDPTDPGCNNSVGSFGQAQLEWLSAKLDEQPTLVLGHHMVPVLSAQETTQGQGYSGLQETLSVAIDAGKRVDGYWVGHTHRWMNFQDAYPFSHRVLGSTRFDDDNYWLVEFGEELTILDAEKSEEGVPCSEDWLYSGFIDYDQLLGGPEFLPYKNPEHPEETGDCQ